MTQATSIPPSSFGFDYWLNKSVEWGQATTFESQQDVCLHLPKLQEFLKQIYGAIQHMKTTAALKSFPMIGQLLGRLCWNPFVVAHDESHQNLLECVWCLYSADPENAVEQKANDWIWNLLQSMISVDQEDRDFIRSLHYPEEEYHLKLLKNMVSSLVKQLQDDQCDRSSMFLRKKILLSESAVVNLWLRYLPSLEQTVLHLIESLVSHPCVSLVELEAIITDSLLPKVSADHPSLFRVIDNFFRTILLETDGHPKIITIIQAFTRCFVQVLLQVQTQMPLKLYFPLNQQSFVVALLTNPSDVPPEAWCQHLITIVQMLKRIVQDEKVKRTTANLFENWFLLVHFGDWLNIALQQLMIADDPHEVLLWLFIFYHKPLMENQQEKQLMEEVKCVYNQLKILSTTANLKPEDVQTALFTNTVFAKRGDLKDLTSQLLVSFILFTEGGNRIAKQSLQLFTSGGDSLDGVSQLLVSTAHRLKNTKCRRAEDRMVQVTVELLQHLLLETNVTVQ
ncbi:Fanconi anemia group C protein isoform X3 [Leucoraja erinacea]|uniref:Fanconi anemia group C protein isoform X3 n=1 Tax=Leucoraja erinaceus TaxID=7782 RepID=UPI0024538470|nr:Fanconi anemia group C protein isoform X3 [Leucoraja erinacea]